MRTRRILAATTAALMATATPALAHPTGALQPPVSIDATHTSTDNVSFVARFPEHLGTAGGVLTSNDAVEDLYVLTDPRGVFTYDVADPTNPVLLGFVPVVQATSGTGLALAQEDPSTDGRIVLVDGEAPLAGTSGMQVVDITDPTAPTVIGTGADTDHTWTCVADVATGNGCAYAYGRTGHVVDLTDPTAPVAAGSWRSAVGYGPADALASGEPVLTNSPYAHDLTQLRPGLVAVAGSTVILMDTTDPTAPVELTRIEQLVDGPDGEPVDRFESTGLGYHSVEWKAHADGAMDRWLVAGTEIAPDNDPLGTGLAGSPDCQGPNSVIETWDATEVITALSRYEVLVDAGLPRATAAQFAFRRAAFRLTDAYDAGGQGIFLDGASSFSQLYCAHWMEVAPAFRDGGMMAVSYYDRGTRFVEVLADGTMEERGWFSGADAYAGSPQWVTDDVVFVQDYRRGLDVLLLTDATATGTSVASSPVHARSVVIAGAVDPAAPAGQPHRAPAFVAAVLLLVLAATGLARDPRAVARRSRD